MIKNLLKLGLLLVAGILIYNYFFGSAAEKEQSKEFFQEVKDLGTAAWGLLKTEKEKLDEGKYDEALDNIGGLFDRLKSEAERGGESITRINDLEQERQKLEDRLRQFNLETEENPNSRTAASDARDLQEEQDLKQDIKKLFEQTERLMTDMEREKQ